jgi:hypothetical protein
LYTKVLTTKVNSCKSHLKVTDLNTDALSRWLDYDDGSGDNKNVTALPDHLFACQILTLSLWEKVSTAQNALAHQVQELAAHFPLLSENHHWWHQGWLVMVENDELKREIVSQYHDAPTAGHPGVVSTLFSISQNYWWPKMKDFVKQYV